MTEKEKVEEIMEKYNRNFSTLQRMLLRKAEDSL